ncbi:MAG TPA: class F sortase [Candidatus Saccharimonadales bacterium]|jgi:LPXTG-site transpeptidase (sortase) family protein|nr:class F sortase [Candidatus Saccharimonadales bacterium]
MSKIHKPGRKVILRIATILIVVGVLVPLYGLIFSGKDPSPNIRKPYGVGEPMPSAAKPTASSIANYTVSAGLPKYIAIPAIGVQQTRIKPLGLIKNRTIATPDNLYDTGWYNGSAKPGESGAMFIYGHVSTWKARGVFYDLKKLKPGDRITVERGDGKLFTYEVNRTTVYPAGKVDMAAVLTPAEPGKPGLNLMTCSGTLLKNANDFTERLVVFTSLIKK